MTGVTAKAGSQVVYEPGPSPPGSSRRRCEYREGRTPDRNRGYTLSQSRMFDGATSFDGDISCWGHYVDGLVSSTELWILRRIEHIDPQPYCFVF